MNYVILTTSEVSSIDFSKVLEDSTDTLRYNNDNTKTFVKFKDDTPSFLDGKTILNDSEIKTELFKEYQIYNTLNTQKYSKDSQATMLIEELVKSHKKINKTQLKRQKYNVIKEIKSKFDFNKLFSSKIKIFERHC